MRRTLGALAAALLLTTGLPAVANAMPPDLTVARYDLDRTHDGLTYAGTATPSWTRGQVKDAFRAFRTGSDHLVAPGPVANTAGSFSVMGWVRLDSSVGNATIASQAGFSLQYHDASDRWSFQLPGGAVNSLAAPVWHEWTHVAGVYDSTLQRAQLWVNGELQGERTVPQPPAGGRLAVGAGQTGADLFEGGIDLVKLYDHAAGSLSIAQSYWVATDRAHYKLNGTARDEYTGQSATLSGTAAWATGEGYSYLNLGGSGHVVGPRPALNANQSYAVMAWVRVGSLPTTSRAIVGGAGTRFSPYLLAYDGVSRKLEFRVVNAAFNQGWVARASATLAPNTWVHVAGTYDSVDKRIELYVNGVFQSRVTNVTAPAPATELRIGGNVWAGQTVAAWPGHVDDLHVMAGLPTVEHIQRIAHFRE